MPDSWGERKSARTPRLFVNIPTRIGGLFGSFMSVSEDIVEQVANEWFQELGYVYPAGPSIALGEPGCETRLRQRGRTPELALVCHRSLQPEGSRSRPGRCSPEGTAGRGTDGHPGQPIVSPYAGGGRGRRASALGGDHRGRSRPAIAAGGGGVSTRVPTVWRRHPAHHIHHRSGADPEDPDTPRRTAQFTPGSRSTRLDLPTAARSSREYTPALSAERHRPEAHCRRLSILSPAVTATGTTFCAA